MIINLDTADDPRIAAYRAVRDRDLIRADRFIVEGAIALERLLTASRFPVESLLLAANRIDALAPILTHLPPHIPVYVTPQAVMDGVTGFPIHRGILALAKRTPPQTPEQLIASLPPGPLTLLVLIGLSNHDNVGGCFRNAAALGADAVLLDKASCDPLYRKSIRVSSGAALSLPFAHAGTGADIIASLLSAGITPWALSPSDGKPLITCEPPQRLALVLGAEGPGLPADLMARCTRVSIPMAGDMDSLNVATAGAIALSHVLSKRSR
ncbi:MAG: RNA methyltransferase [Hyphomonadaceae bacterium]